MGTTDGDRPCGCGGVSPAGARFCAWCGRGLEPDGSRTQYPEEWRTTTAVFADLSNFSRLVAILDIEELLTLVEPVLRSLVDIVERHGGSVEKFAGDALLALFGAPVAHENDPQRAVQAALAMHADLAERDAGSNEPWRVHVGVATGPVVGRTIGLGSRGDYAVIGDAVVLAQRLQSAAGPGETYLDEATAALVGSEFALEPLGELTLKGREHPIAAFRLGARRRRGMAPAGDLVSRDRQLDALVGALAEAARGTTVVRVLTGPAGFGKSQLLARLRRYADTQAIPVVDLVATSLPGPPYATLQPLVERAVRRRHPQAVTLADALANLGHHDDGPASAALTAVLLGSPERTQPSLADRMPAVLRRELTAAAVAWCRDLAAGAPLLLTIDNAQWLDAPSADVVTALANAAEVALLVCLAARDTDLVPLAEMTQIARVEQIDLPPLDRSEVADLVRAELGLTPSPKLVSVLADRGAGNPLAVRESLRQLDTDSLLDVRHGHVRLVSGASPSTAPAALTTLLAARIDVLTPTAVDIATTAAVVGPSTPVALLRALTGEARAAFDAGLDQLVAGGVVTIEQQTMRFDSPLSREVLYHRLTGRRRRGLHARVAAVLGEDPDSPAPLLAEHLYRSGAAAQALPILIDVARQARRVFDHDAAARTLSDALACAGVADPDLVPELWCELGDVRLECGEYESAATAYAEAIIVGAGARAWAGRAGAVRRSGDHDTALSLLNEALDADPEGDRRLIWCELAWTHSVAGRLQLSRAAADQGLGQSAAEDEVVARLLLQRVRVATLLGELDTATADADRAVRVLEREGDTAGLCTALRLLGDLHHQRGDREAAVAALERGLAIAERAGLVEEQGGCLVNLGLVHGERDHAAASAAYARAALVFEQIGHAAGCATAYGNRAYEVFMLGDLVGGRELGHRALAFAEPLGHHLAMADVHHTLALIAERGDDRPQARRHAAAAIAEFEAAGLPQAAGSSHELAERLG